MNYICNVHVRHRPDPTCACASQTGLKLCMRDVAAHMQTRSPVCGAHAHSGACLHRTCTLGCRSMAPKNYYIFAP